MSALSEKEMEQLYGSLKKLGLLTAEKLENNIYGLAVMTSRIIIARSVNHNRRGDCTEGEKENAENWNHRRKYATGRKARPCRVGAQLLKSRNDAEFEIVDIEDYKLPLLDEPVRHNASVSPAAH